MPQPVKKAGTYQKPRPKTVKKRTKPTVGEIIKKSIARSKKPHPKYGTSKLEKRFAKEFLDKLGIKYEWQFKMDGIGRYMDFYCREANIGIEVDGDWFHSYGLIYEQMNPMQKKNYRVDKIKDEWAKEHRIKLIRIWEHDINNNPAKVMTLLREEFGIGLEKEKKKREKNQRH